MKTEELKTLIETNTSEDGIDIEAINKAVNAETDALIDRKVLKVKDTVRDEVITEFVKEQGYDNMDAYKAFLTNSKASSTELSQKATRLEQELEATKSKLGEYEGEVTKYRTTSKISELGIDSKFGDYAMYEINKMISDEVDFETAAKEFVEKNQHILAQGTEPTINMRPTTQTTTLKQGFDDDVLNAFKKRNPSIDLD